MPTSEKIYVVYGNLNRNNDPDYKVYGAFKELDMAKTFAESIATEALEKLDLVAEEAWMNERIHDGNKILCYSTNDWEVEIYIAEVSLR